MIRRSASYAEKKLQLVLKKQYELKNDAAIIIIIAHRILSFLFVLRSENAAVFVLGLHSSSSQKVKAEENATQATFRQQRGSTAAKKIFLPT